MSTKCSALHSAGVLLLVLLAAGTVQSQVAYENWQPGTATFYGGSDASGTMGGACGYGNMFTNGYGTLTAAASTGLWMNGLACGACYQVQCVGADCIGSGTVTVTVTNNCPHGSTGGWCDGYKKHLDMAMPAYKRIGKVLAGAVHTRMRKVACSKVGAIKYQTSGNPWFLSVTFTNIAGPGDLRQVFVQANNEGYKAMDHNWGASYSIGGQFLGKSLSFKLVSGTAGKTLVVPNAVPSSWNIGGVYSRGQFGAGGRAPGRKPNRKHKKGRKYHVPNRRHPKGLK